MTSGIMLNFYFLRKMLKLGGILGKRKVCFWVQDWKPNFHQVAPRVLKRSPKYREKNCVWYWKVYSWIFFHFLSIVSRTIREKGGERKYFLSFSQSFMTRNLKPKPSPDFSDTVTRIVITKIKNRRLWIQKSKK